MMFIGAIAGIIISITEMYLSYYLNVLSGAAIVLVVSGLFLLVLLFSPSQGILTRPETANHSLLVLRQLKNLKKRI